MKTDYTQAEADDHFRRKEIAGNGEKLRIKSVNDPHFPHYVAACVSGLIARQGIPTNDSARRDLIAMAITMAEMCAREVSDLRACYSEFLTKEKRKAKSLVPVTT